MILLGYIGAAVNAPWWYWLVYSVTVAGFLVPLIEGFIEGFTHAEPDSDD